MSARKKRISPAQRRSLATARDNIMRRRVEWGFQLLFLVVIITIGIAFGIYHKNNGGKSFAAEHPAAFILISVICGVLIGFYLYMDIRKNRPRRPAPKEEDKEDSLSRKARRAAVRQGSLAGTQSPLMNKGNETNDASCPACEHRSAHA